VPGRQRPYEILGLPRRAASQQIGRANGRDESTQRRQAAVKSVLEGRGGHQQCLDQAIFASGSDVAEATQHDIEALAVNPGWVKLNYELGSTKPGAGWQSCPDKLPGQECDEYPFFATEQGGPLARPVPHRKAIDADDNGLQGVRYSSFRSTCSLQTGTPQVGGNSVGGTPFLGIPIPPSTGIPTWYGCRRRP
jgi:hypothetical protein